MAAKKLHLQKVNKVANVNPRTMTLARTVRALGASFLVTFNDDTSLIRVHAIAQDIYMKWALTGVDFVTAANFDEMIHAGNYIDFPIPVDARDGTLFTRAMFVGRVGGSTVVVIEK